MNVLKRTGKSNGTEINKRLGVSIAPRQILFGEYCSILKCCCAWLLTVAASLLLRRSTLEQQLAW